MVFTANVELLPKKRLEQVRIPREMNVRVDVLPKVVELQGGALVVVECHVDNGSVVRRVRHARFHFVD